MTVTQNLFKRLKLIQATLDVSDNAANNIFIQVDTAADTNGANAASNRKFYSHVEVTSSAGAQKTGWTKSYIFSGVSAGYLQINKGSLTFATNDIVTVIGTLR
jgi:hypothetical protein